MMCSLEKLSSYYSGLSAEAKQRYQQKIATTGLKVDPYVIEESQWTREPEEIPLLQWSDIVLYMVSTPSPYTRETIKVILAL